MPLLIAAAAVLTALILVIFIRAMRFTPRISAPMAAENVEVDTERAVSDLAEMIRCRTVSDRDPTKEDECEFDKFKSLLKKLFPKIYDKCDYEEVGSRALLFRYKGKNSYSPLVLMAHFDVVSAQEDKWTKPPFDGVYEDGVLWGRGTLDTKGTLNGIMQAVEKHISEGFVPENDIYLAFAGDEEIGAEASARAP